MKIRIDEDILWDYAGEEVEQARAVCDNLKKSAALLEEAKDYNLTLAQLEIIEKLAGKTGLPDADAFYIYCQGFARGRQYEQDHSKG